MLSARKLIAFICLAALLLVLATPGSSGLLLAILSPLVLFLVALVAIAAISPVRLRVFRASPALPVFAPRPPPIR